MTALRDLTTLRVGGPAARVVLARTDADLIAAVRRCDAEGEPLLLVAGGSNLVVADEGFLGTAVLVCTRGIEAAASDGEARLRVAAGEPWDGVVERAVGRGWSGIEALSGIPGSTGATPVQNVGAYGQEVAQTLAEVRVWDRATGCERVLAPSDCAFGYRTSQFKAEWLDGAPRCVVLEVTFALEAGGAGTPIRYAELARALGVEVGGSAPPDAVRAAVLAMRRGKGMVLDPGDHDTWSAGSFFTNPVLTRDDAERLPADAPRWPTGAGVKTSAAWLIERAGFGRGYGLPGPASLSTKHTLALTNRGSATTSDLLALAREVRDGVRTAFGVTLEPEPTLVGCHL